MFSSALIALLVSLSVMAWTYSKFMRTTGNNTQKAVTGAGLLGLMAFIAVLIILFFLDRYFEG
jgi:uncharacterized membrane protein YdjX (TVP38/TMEM64 family)